jgi:Fe-S cluster assembly protein SufD
MKNNIIVKKNETLTLPIVWTGLEKEINYNISLNGVGASINFLMLLLGNKENKVNINVNITHANQDTKSKVIVKGVLNDSSNVEFNGLVKISKKSKLSNTWLAAHLLLLSDKAKGKAVPSLEILENDIKAGHATTVGRVNDLEVFYLMSRGLTKTKAKQIIVTGFLSGFLDEFPDGQIKENALKLIRHAI